MGAGGTPSDGDPTPPLLHARLPAVTKMRHCAKVVDGIQSAHCRYQVPDAVPPGIAIDCGDPHLQAPTTSNIKHVYERDLIIYFQVSSNGRSSNAPQSIQSLQHAQLLSMLAPRLSCLGMVHESLGQLLARVGGNAYNWRVGFWAMMGAWSRGNVTP